MAKKRRRAAKLNWKALGAAALGGVAIGAGAYAVDGLTLKPMISGLIKAGAGLVVGTGVSMVSPSLGAGIVGGGVGLGTYQLGAEALGGLAQPATEAKTDETVKSIRANLGAMRQPRVMLPGGQRAGSGVDVSAAANLRAIMAKIPA